MVPAKTFLSRNSWFVSQ